MIAPDKMKIVLSAIRRKINNKIDQLESCVDQANGSATDKQKYTMLINGLVSILAYYHRVITKWRRRNE